MNCNRTWGLIIAWGLVLSAVGCSSEGPEVKGTVTLDGKPLARARVNFMPLTNVNTATTAAAFCDENGNFTVIPQAEGRTLDPANYGVTVSRKADAQGNVPSEEDYGMMEASGTLIESVPAKYTVPPPDNNYPLQVEIKEGGPVPPIELKLLSQ
jgi:hypothetical protein